jgi:hypothetical protein
MWRIHVTIVAMETQQYCSFFIVVGVDVAAKNRSLWLSVKMQKLFPIALLSNHKIFRSAFELLKVMNV